MQRILIIGNSGAGKSTLARQLAQRLQLELIHLDQHYWLPGWTEPKKEKWEETVGRLVQQEKWVIDGNYTSSLPIRHERADTIIFLDRSRWICLWNVFKRLIQYYGRVRPDLSADCPERLDWPFLRYVYHYDRDYKPRVLKSLGGNSNPDAHLIVLRSRKEIDRFLHNLTDYLHS